MTTYYVRDMSGVVVGAIEARNGIAATAAVMRGAMGYRLGLGDAFSVSIAPGQDAPADAIVGIPA